MNREKNSSFNFKSPFYLCGIIHSETKKNQIKWNHLLKCAENMCVRVRTGLCSYMCCASCSFFFWDLRSPHTFVVFLLLLLLVRSFCLFVFVIFVCTGKFIRIPYKGNDLISLFSTSELVISSKYKPNLCAHRENTKWKWIAAVAAFFFFGSVCDLFVWRYRTSPCFLQHEYPCKQLLTSA